MAILRNRQQELEQFVCFLRRQPLGDVVQRRKVDVVEIEMVVVLRAKANGP